MELALAIGTSIAVAVVLLALVAFAQRRWRLLRSLAFPLYVAALAAGVKTFTLFGLETHAEIDSALTWLLVFLATIAVVRLVALFYFDLYLHGQRGVRLPPLLPTVVTWAAYVGAALAILKVAVPDLPLTALVTTSAVTSLILGLALQPILGNFFAGMVITLEKPFRINDWIRFGDTEARVVAITWRTTHLRTRDNDTLIVPNGRIADQEVLNYAYPHPMRLERVYVGVHYRTPPYRVKQALMDVAARVDGVLEKPSPSVYLHDFDESAIRYELRVWIEDIAHKPRIASHLKSEIWEEFRRRRFTIPFPIRTLEIEPRARTVELLREAAEATAATAVRGSLYVARGDDRGLSVELGDGVVTVGRSGHCELRLTAPQVSKEHFRIERDGDDLVLTDLDSSHGTSVNGHPATRHVLRDLDRISIDDTVLVFEDAARG